MFLPKGCKTDGGSVIFLCKMTEPPSVSLTRKREMRIAKRPLILCVIGASLYLILWGMIHGGWEYSKDFVTRTYHNSSNYEKRSTCRRLDSMAREFEERRMKPPITANQIDGMMDCIQPPMQFQMESGKPILRSAGHDKIFYTRDDITRPVNIPPPVSKLNAKAQ
jgi:hypothetical protein